MTHMLLAIAAHTRHAAGKQKSRSTCSRQSRREQTWSCGRVHAGRRAGFYKTVTGKLTIMPSVPSVFEVEGETTHGLHVRERLR
jgi:hypothetical protein